MELIEPPLPDDVDLRDFAFMPLDVLRLRDSDFATVCTGEEFRAGLLLWCASWHRVPAASLPDDDRVLAALAGFGRGPAAELAWLDVKDRAMHGWRKSTDGLYYHEVIVEKALEAWRRKQEALNRRLEHAERMRLWREKRQSSPQDSTEGDVIVTDTRRDNHVKRTRDHHVTSLTGTGTGTGTGTKINTPHTPLPGGSLVPEAKAEYPADFEDWWQAYPRKDGKGAALKAYRNAKKRIGAGAVEKLLGRAQRFALWVRTTGHEFVPLAATWLNQSRYDDPEKPMPQQEAHPLAPKGRDAFGMGG